jgi:hypothetical protein
MNLGYKVVEALGAKNPGGFYDLASKAIGAVDAIGSKLVPALGYVKSFLPAPVQIGLDLFQKAVGAKDVLQTAINTGERIINRVAGPPQQATPQAMGAMVDKARDTIEKINMARTRPFMANRVNTLVLPNQMGAPKMPNPSMLAF